MKQQLFCIDPANDQSGIVSIVNNTITRPSITPNDDVFALAQQFASEHTDHLVLIEDIAPYSTRFNQDVIDTCKWIGELTYRLKSAGVNYKLILRWEVKQWVFKSFPDVSIPRIRAKIEAGEKKGKFIKKDGSLLQPSFVFVDDRIVTAAMKKHWGIETPKPGKSNSIGIRKDAWQALALGSYYIATAY